MTLRDVLKGKDTERGDNYKLYPRLLEIELIAKSILTYTHVQFPQYTLHDFSHSLSVEKNLDWLIPDEIKKNLEAEEIFFLILSA